MRAALIALLLSQPMPPLRVLDEGVVKGYASQVNCVGAGVTCEVNPTGVVWKITVPGGSGTNVIDVSSAPIVTTAATNLLSNEQVVPTCLGNQKLTFNGTSLSCATDIDTTDLTIPTYTRAAAPACSSTWLSKEIRVHDTGQEDQTWVCQFDSVGSYQWTVYSQAPSAFSTTLPDGTVVVTVGATFTNDGTYFTGFTPTYGADTAGVFYSTTSPTATKSKMRSYFAIGATKKFTAVQLVVSNAPARSFWKSNHSPSYESMSYPNGGYAVVSALGTPPSSGQLSANWRANDSPNIYNQDGALSCALLSVTSSGVSSFEFFVGTEWVSEVSASYWDYKPFADGSGEIVLSGLPAGWTKGWSVCSSYAQTGPSPTGITVADYYWVVFSNFDWVDRNCGLDPSSNTCGYTSVGNNFYSSGPLYTPIIVRAVSVR